MKKHVPLFQELSLDQIQFDPDQPRRDFGTEGDENRLLISIRDIGIQQPIVVSRIDMDRYIILDGHRRYICAQKLQMQKVPCRIYERMSTGEFERLRFEIQNNRRDWKPLERSDCLSRIKEAKSFKTNRELALYLHLSETVIGSSLQIRQQTMEYIGLMEKYDLPESYRVEFIRIKPRIRKIKGLEVSNIIRALFEKVQHKVIKNAKDFRKLSKIFQRAHHNEEVLYKFLTDPDMTVDELNQDTIQSTSSLLGEKFLREISIKKQHGVEFSPQEKAFFIELRNFLTEVLA